MGEVTWGVEEWIWNHDDDEDVDDDDVDGDDGDGDDGDDDDEDVDDDDDKEGGGEYEAAALVRRQRR